MPMKILRVISSMNPTHGGPSQGIRNSIPKLAEIGVLNEVVSLDDPTMEFVRNQPFVIHPVGQESGPWKYNRNLIPWLESNIHKYDIVIVHGLWLFHSYAVTKVIRQLKSEQSNYQIPKVYIMPHGMLDPYFQKSKGRKLKALRNWIYWNLVEHRVIKEADGILFTCEEELHLAKLSFRNYQPKKELNIGYGITPAPELLVEDVELFRDKFGLKEGDHFMLFLSRIHEKKGVDLLVLAFLKLKEEGFNLPKLVIAGPGLDSNYGKSIVASCKLEQDIIFPGMLKGNFKWAAFLSCDAFILPSHQENFGISIVEAMACGKPVLISNKVNIWREIASGKGGLIADDTEVGVYSMIKQWVEMSAVEKLNMADSAFQLFSNQFTIEEAANKMKRILLSN